MMLTNAMKSHLRPVFLVLLPALLLPWAVSGADAPKVPTEAVVVTPSGWLIQAENDDGDLAEMRNGVVGTGNEHYRKS